jgi:hypothetical protein
VASPNFHLGEAVCQMSFAGKSESGPDPSAPRSSQEPLIVFVLQYIPPHGSQVRLEFLHFRGQSDKILLTEVARSSHPCVLVSAHPGGEEFRGRTWYGGEGDSRLADRTQGLRQYIELDIECIPVQGLDGQPENHVARVAGDAKRRPTKLEKCRTRKWLLDWAFPRWETKSSK